MEKVKLTKLQAEAIEIIKTDTKSGWTYGNLKTQNEKTWKDEPFASLNKLSFSDFLDALHVGYEVEEEYRGDEWVVNTANGKVANIERVAPDRVWVDDENARYFMKSALRHATPEEIKAEQERRVWKSIGREVGELKFGDKYVTTFDANRTIVCSVSKEMFLDILSDGEVRVFYPIESAISFGGDSHDN